MDWKPQGLRCWAWGAVLASLLIAGCGSKPKKASAEPSQQDIAMEARARQNAEAINTQLAQQSTLLSAAGTVAQEYRIGPGDSLEIDVYRVEELSQTERVNARGSIILPLLGAVEVAGKTVAEVEAELTARLERDFMHEPQVSVFVADYRSAEVVVAGAVRQPAVYSVTRPHTLLEILLLAGGVSDDAGYKVNVHTRVAGEGGTQVPLNVIIDLRTLMSDFEANQKLVVKGGDSVFVQRAGYVYVQGAVKRSGAFKIEGEIDVLKALAMAGGVAAVADHDDIKVFRETVEGTEIFELDYDLIREDRGQDIALADGDLIVVGNDALKSAFFGAWAVARGIFTFARF